MICQGDIRLYQFGRPDKCRPVLVVCRDALIPSLSRIPVIPCSTQIRGLRSEVLLTPADGMPVACVLKPDWIQVVPPQDLRARLTSLPRNRWSEIRAALLHVLGLDHLPEDRCG
jgi:mRNA interferase MazF